MSNQKQTPLSNLPNPSRIVTGHNSEGKAIIHSQSELGWRHVDQDRTAMSVVYTTSSFPVNLNHDEDISTHQAALENGIGLVNPNGTVIRCVDFGPGYSCPMHRTKSLDYGIVLEGEIDMLLDSGDVVSMKKGDVAIQRATQHQWINKSKTNWARMMFVLQDCATLDVGGKQMVEDLGTHAHMIRPSGN